MDAPRIHPKEVAMTWTRLDDRWTDSPALEEVSFEDRWHYLAMIQRCTRTETYDGTLRAVDARRCSDHPDPAGAIARLTEAGLVEVVQGGKYRVLAIDDHTPPPWVRKKTERDRDDKRRKRAHDVGDHSLCKSDAPCVVTTGVSTVGSDSRTGQVRSGRDEVKKAILPTNEWPVVHISKAPVCEVCMEPMSMDAALTICETDDERHDDARMRTAS